MRRSAAHIATLAALAALPAAADPIEELVITATHDQRTVDVTDAISVSPDVAQLLKKAPGVDVNSNGPLTGLTQYRGMYGVRVCTALDGMQLASAGPNAMDPPLSYAVGGQLESLRLHRGIAPVSAAQEAIGGLVEAISYRGEFAAPGERTLQGRIIANAQSVNNGTHLNSALVAAGDSQRLKLAAMIEQGDDAEFPGGELLPTEYTRQRYDIGYGFRVGDHSLQLDYAYNDTGDSGTPALPMDIEIIEGDLYRLNYSFDGSTDLKFDATLFASALDHTMTNFQLRTAPPASRWRRNTADSRNLGFEFNASVDQADGAWQAGIDGFHEKHDSDIDNPNNAMFFVQNFNEAEREVFGIYLQRQQTLSDTTRAEFGVRYNRVNMDAGSVDGTPARMMPMRGQAMVPGAVLRDGFNSADRSVSDDNIDLVARSWFAVTEYNKLYLGLARKTRSPSYQERFLWLPLEATGGLADGNLYTGNIELDPEVSRTLELGMDYSRNGLTLSPRVYYSSVKDYIQGVPSDNQAAIMLVRMMNNMNGTNNADPLIFDNVDARLYGFDMDWAWQLSNHWSLSGLVNYVRGKRDDASDDELYRIAPPNATLRLHYRRHAFSTELEGIAYAEQDNVSATNREQRSANYGVVNLLVRWQASDQLSVSAGVDNLFDRRYRPHLGGYNRAANPDIGPRERLPAAGINTFARLAYEF